MKTEKLWCIIIWNLPFTRARKNSHSETSQKRIQRNCFFLEELHGCSQQHYLKSFLWLWSTLFSNLCDWINISFPPIFIFFIQMQFLYVLYLINFTFNDFIFLITYSDFNQKIITHILNIVLIERSHIFF